MSISHEKFMRALKLMREKKIRAFFFLKGSKYILSFNGLIRARDKNFGVVEWSRAFGSKTPYEVLGTFKVERVEVYMKRHPEPIIFSSFDDFIRWIEKRMVN